MDLTQKQVADLNKVIERAVSHAVSGSRWQDAGDMINTAWEVLLSGGFDAYDPAKGMKLTSYVWMVAHSVAIDYMRKGRRFLPYANPLECVHDAYVSNGDTSVALREVAARLSACINGLSEQARFIFEALYGSQYGDGEVERVASTLGIKPSAVRKSLSLTRKKLREAIEAE